ncbi:MAG: TIM barrel protein [Saonia sp.]
MKCDIRFYFIFFLFLSLVRNMNGQGYSTIFSENIHPWCIVAYDSLERSPTERIKLIKELGFTKYAYDWRDRHLDETSYELELATKNNIEVIGVWLWLNAKRDSTYGLSDANEQLFKIVEQLNLRTIFWVGLSPNFFETLSDSESLEKAVEIIDFVSKKAAEIDCGVALYNHSGWFADPYNQLKILKALPQHKLGLVYNFHHAHSHIEEFPKIARAIQPYLFVVNLNGMVKSGEKIMPIGKGKYEVDMVKTLLTLGFDGPWGIMGHVENTDVRKVLEQNIQGLKTMRLE